MLHTLYHTIRNWLIGTKALVSTHRLQTQHINSDSVTVFRLYNVHNDSHIWHMIRYHFRLTIRTPDFSVVERTALIFSLLYFRSSFFSYFYIQVHHLQGNIFCNEYLTVLILIQCSYLIFSLSCCKVFLAF